MVQSVKYKSLVLPVIFLAIVIGGGWETWQRGVILIAGGICFHSFSPRRGMNRTSLLLCLSVMALACMHLLPDPHAFPSFWENMLSRDFQIQFPFTYAPQPWIALEQILVFGFGLTWLLVLTSNIPEQDEKNSLARGYCLGVSGIALIAILFHFLKFAPSIWHAENHFGSFPNRNQFANLLALTALINLACLYEDSRAEKRRSALLLAASQLVLLTALVMTHSKAGLIIFFLAASLWAAWTGVLAKNGRRFCLNLSGILFLLTLFFLFGGDVLQRFFVHEDGSNEWTQNFRWLIYLDTLPLILNAPLLGVGPGHFTYVFPFFRNHSISESLILHPESDLIWFAVELGIPAVLILIYLMGSYIKPMLRIERTRGYTTRIASTLAILFFCLHSLFDVSAHRLGTWLILPLLIVFATESKTDESTHIESRKGYPLMSYLWIALGVCWILTGAHIHLVPTSAQVKDALEESHALVAREDYLKSLNLINQAIRIAPMDWQLYHSKARILGATGKISEARQSFQVARGLQPTLASIRMQEGSYWIALRHPELALPPWIESLGLSKDIAGNLFWKMLNQSTDLPQLRSALIPCATQSSTLFLVFARIATPQEWKPALSELLKRDPKLEKFDRSELRELFDIWIRMNDTERMEQVINLSDRLKDIGWYWNANILAQKSQYEEAYSIVTSKDPPPLPMVNPSMMSVEELDEDFRLHPNDFSKGYLLLHKLIRLRNEKEVLYIFDKLKALPDCPAYLYYIESVYHGNQMRWKQAWECWLEYRKLKNN